MKGLQTITGHAYCHASSTQCHTKEGRHAAKWENKRRKLAVAYTLSGDMMVRALSLGLSVWYMLIFIGSIGTPCNRSFIGLDCRFVVVLVAVHHRIQCQMMSCPQPDNGQTTLRQIRELRRVLPVASQMR